MKRSILLLFILSIFSSYAYDWEKVAQYNEADFYLLSYNDGTLVIHSKFAKIIATSTDEGKTWNEIISPGYIDRLYVVNDSLGNKGLVAWTKENRGYKTYSLEKGIWEDIEFVDGATRGSLFSTRYGELYGNLFDAEDHILGIYVSKDMGKTFLKILPTHLFLGAHQMPDSTVIIKYNDSLLIKSPSDLNWVSRPRGLIEINAPLASDSNYLYSIISELGIARSSDQGLTWESISNENDHLNTVSSIYPIGNNDLLITSYKRDNVSEPVGSYFVYKNSGEDKGWRKVQDSVVDRLHSLLYLPGSGLYKTIKDGLFVSKDYGKSWTKIKTNIPGRYISAVYLNSSSSTIAGTINGDILISDNHGESYTLAVDANYSGYSRALEIIKTRNGNFIVPRKEDTFYSKDNGISWQKADLPEEKAFQGKAITFDNTTFYNYDFKYILRSTDEGENWSVFLTLEDEILSLAKADDNTMIASTLKNSSRIHEDGSITSIPFLQDMSEMVLRETNGRMLIITNRNYSSLVMLRTSNNGLNWDTVRFSIKTSEIIENMETFIIDREGNLYFSSMFGLTIIPWGKKDVLKDFEEQPISSLSEQGDKIVVGTLTGAIYTMDIPVSVEERNQMIKSDLSIYPNPGSGMFSFKIITESAGPACCEVYNLFGSKVYSVNFDVSTTKENHDLDLGHLPSGHYTVVMRTANGVSSDQLRIVK